MQTADSPKLVWVEGPEVSGPEQTRSHRSRQPKVQKVPEQSTCL